MSNKNFRGGQPKLPWRKRSLSLPECPILLLTTRSLFANEHIYCQQNHLRE